MTDLSHIHYRWSYGGDKSLADTLLGLVLSGKKTATTGLYIESEKFGKKGDYAIIYDEASGKDLCVIEYTQVNIVPFMDVEFDYIQKEGECDTSRETWRESHREFFQREYPNDFSDDSEVVCEEFILVKSLL